MTAFVAWLHGQALGDPKREMPYARLYEAGPLVEAAIGMYGEFDLPTITAAIRERYEDTYTQMELCEAVVAAEAVWRVDGLVTDLVDIDPKVERARYACGYRSIDGVRCSHPAVEGAARCSTHGGAISDPEVRRSILLSSYARIMAGSQDAVEALISVAVDGRSEMARVQAAKELLDRAGLVQDQHVHLHVPDKDDASTRSEAVEALRTRLGAVRERLEIEPAAYDADEEIIEAEVVDE